MHANTNYSAYTDRGTKDTTGNEAEIYVVKIYRAIESLSLMFQHIDADYKAGKLSQENFDRYVKYYGLLFSDTLLASKQLHSNEELVKAVAHIKAKN